MATSKILYKNDGTSTSYTITYVEPMTTAPSASDLGWSRDGYEFVNWNTQANGSGDAVEVEEYIMMYPGDLYAIWQEILPDEYLVDASDMTSVANAIRAKSGGSSPLSFPTGFVSEIGNIPTGSGYILDDIAQHNFTGVGVITITNVDMPQYTFAKSKFTSFSAPNFKDKNLPAHFIRESTQLTSASFPLLNKSISAYTCYGCSALTSFYAPNVITSEGYNFENCPSLLTLALPSLAKTGNSATGTNIAKGCTSLTAADIGGAVRIDASAFMNCSSLNVLVLRKSNALTTLANVNAFSGTPFASGGTGGTIYIPKALYDHLGDNSSSDYKAATNWATIEGYGTITWAKIEDSIYETKSVDGNDLPS